MLDTVLDPITNREWDSQAKKYLCLAYAMLAYYASESFPARVLESFRRAWFHDSVTRVPGVSGGRPAFLIVPFREGGRDVLVVAIAGTTSLWQWTGLTEIPAFSSFDGPNTGWICKVMSDYALAIRSLLDADPDFLAAKNTRGARIVFTGHSLGGAIADICAKYYSRHTWNARFSAVKFACPRIGDREYVELGRRNYDQWNYYTEFDPVDVFPFNAQNVFEFAEDRLLNPETLLLPDTSEYRMNSMGEWVTKPSVVVNANAVRLAAELGRTLAIDSLWRDHAARTYRLSLSNQLNGTETLMKYRFLHWELPDNNSWGAQFRSARTIDSAMENLADPPPSDFPVPSNLLTVHMSGGGPWGDGSISATGDWGLSEAGGRNGNIDRPEPRQVPFLRRQHRPIGGTHR